MLSHALPWRWVAPLVLLGLAASDPLRLCAQDAPAPILRGEVRVGDGLLSDGMVVLHQVSAEASGEVDSVRVRPDGSFQIRLPYLPDHATRAEIFFASVRHGGLYYFGPAITDVEQLDSMYTIQAFDTLSVPDGGIDLPLTVRNLFLEASESGWEATDVFQVRHDGARTLYSPDEGVIWSYPLPASAREFEVGQADMAPDAIRFTNGRMELFAPLPPGERFLVVRYHIPEREFIVPMPGRTDRMEILVREPGPPAEFPPLVPAPPMELEPGSVFRRYAGDGLVDAAIHGRVAPERWSIPAEWIGILLAGVLGAAGVYGFRRRRPDPKVVPDGGGAVREQLLLAIAEIDEEFERKKSPTHADRESYRIKRATLLDELKRQP